MDSRAQRRARLVPALARLTRSRDFRNSMVHAETDARSMTIIPVLPDDTMRYVFDRLVEAGNRGVIAKQDGEDFAFIVLWPASAARVEVAREDDMIDEIHPDCHVDMLFQLLDKIGTTVIREVAAQLMETGGRELAGR